MQTSYFISQYVWYYIITCKVNILVLIRKLIGHQGVQVKETRSNVFLPVALVYQLSNQSAVILSFVAVLSYLIKGLDGNMRSVEKVLVRSCHSDTESTIKLKALTSKCYCLRN